MPNVFDTRGGQLLVAGHIALRRDVTLDEVVADGFEFVRETDLKTGMKFRTTTPQVLGNHTVNLAMEFKDGVLKGVNFALNEYATGDMETDLESMFLRHCEFLEQELGKPDKQSMFEQSYRFPWGGITSLKDTKGGFSYVYVRWAGGG